MHYRWKTGMLAWVLFRVTGLALVGYLAMHLMVISNLHDPNKFDATMRFLGSWQFRILELGLFFVVLYHALNGIRVIIVDFFNGSVHQARLFWGLAALGFVLFIAGAYPMVSHALYWKDVQQGRKTHQEVGSGTTNTIKEEPAGRPNRPGRSRRSDRANRPTRQGMYQPNQGDKDYNPNAVIIPPPPLTSSGLAPDPADALIKPVPNFEPIEQPKRGK